VMGAKTETFYFEWGPLARVSGLRRSCALHASSCGHWMVKFRHVEWVL